MPESKWPDHSGLNLEEIRKALLSFQESTKANFKALEEISNSLAPPMENFTKAFEVVRKSGEEFNAILARIPTGFDVIKDLGWFPDLKMTPRMFNRLGELEQGDVNQEVGNWFKGRLSQIEAELVKAYPKRSRLIYQAFWAHSEEKFSLSILSLLSQANGIWNEELSTDVFHKV